MASGGIAVCARAERSATFVDPNKSSLPFLCCFLFFLIQSGETEPLDLGAPISSLDGLRVVLERAEPAPGKGKTVPPQEA